jgi:hypothetical protein
LAAASDVGEEGLLGLWLGWSGIRIRAVFKDDGSLGVSLPFSVLGFFKIGGRGLIGCAFCGEDRFSASPLVLIVNVDKEGISFELGDRLVVYIYI